MTAESTSPAQIGPDWVKLAAGISYCDLRKSDGDSVTTGEIVHVHYQVALGAQQDGVPNWIDSSWTTTSPFRFIIGAGQVLKGIDIAVLGMRVAEERRIIMTHDWAYGDRGLEGLIPPNATLTVQIYVVMKETLEGGLGQ